MHYDRLLVSDSFFSFLRETNAITHRCKAYAKDFLVILKRRGVLYFSPIYPISWVEKYRAPIP